MSDIQILPVESQAELDAFILLPWDIYATTPQWVPPLKSEEKKLLDTSNHPFWQQAQGKFFLAVQDGRVVGRIAAMVDHKYNAYAKERCGTWGFFECQNNIEAAHGLLNATAQWLKEQGMEHMRGPLNPSSNYTCGMLVDGFEHAPSIMMPWNHEYYPALMESWPMRKEQDLFAYTFGRESMQPPAWLLEQVQVIKERQEFTWRTSSKATLTDDIHTMLELYQQSWANNWGFTPMSLEEAKTHVHTLKSVLDPNFFVLFFCNDTPVGGMLALPDMNYVLKRLNGSLGLSAPWHLWRAQKDVRNNYRLLLFGIREEYRLMGLPLLLLDFMLEQARKRPNFQSVEGSWTLEDNGSINDLMEDFGGKITKRYRIYGRELYTV